MAAIVVQSASRASPLQEVSDVTGFHMDDSRFMIASLEVQVALTGVPREKLANTTVRAAAAILLLSYERRHLLESALVRACPRERLLHYIDATQYDETPMAMRVVGDPKVAAPNSSAGTLPVIESVVW